MRKADAEDMTKMDDNRESDPHLPIESLRDRARRKRRRSERSSAFTASLDRSPKGTGTSFPGVTIDRSFSLSPSLFPSQSYSDFSRWSVIHPNVSEHRILHLRQVIPVAVACT